MLAMFIANTIWESGGFVYTEEVACKDGGCPGSYQSPEDNGKLYHGRGYIQLTWYENYMKCSMGLYGDDRLVQDPDQVARDPEIAMKSALWYWGAVVMQQPGVSEYKFGATVAAINGPLECGTGSETPAKRFAIYTKIFELWNLPGTPNNEGC
jgi:predicted chitinase